MSHPAGTDEVDGAAAHPRWDERGPVAAHLEHAGSSVRLRLWPAAGRGGPGERAAVLMNGLKALAGMAEGASWTLARDRRAGGSLALDGAAWRLGGALSTELPVAADGAPLPELGGRALVAAVGTWAPWRLWTAPATCVHPGRDYVVYALDAARAVVLARDGLVSYLAAWAPAQLRSTRVRLGGGAVEAQGLADPARLLGFLEAEALAGVAIARAPVTFEGAEADDPTGLAPAPDAAGGPVALELTAPDAAAAHPLVQTVSALLSAAGVSEVAVG